MPDLPPPDLRVCPFCGGTDVRPFAFYRSCWVVTCRGCQAGGPDAPDREAAVAAWNRRAGEAKPETLAERMHREYFEGGTEEERPTRTELLAKMTPEKRALFEQITELRRWIGPVDFDVVEALREMREGD